MKIIPYFLVVALLGLSACGGGGGGDSDSSVAPERPSSSISGIAFDGLIIGGTVEVFDFTGGIKGQRLGTTVTDGSGLYSISLTTPDKPVLIEISGGY